MAEDNQKLEELKIRREIEKLESEIRSIRLADRRHIIMLISIIVGIGLSTIGIFNATNEISDRNKALALESNIKSHEIFLNQVLDKLSGTKYHRKKTISDDSKEEIIVEQYGGTTAKGALAVTVSLSSQFPALRDVAIKVLEHRAISAGQDYVEPYLTQLKELRK